MNPLNVLECACCPKKPNGPGCIRAHRRHATLLALTGIALSAALFPPSCAVPAAVRGHYTPAELYRHADALAGQTVSVRGKVEVVSRLCTEQVCKDDNPCCNSCWYSLGFSIDEFRKIYFSGDAASCSGDGCHADCPLIQPDGIYTVTGRFWKDLGDVPYLEISEWRLIEPAARTTSPP